jgi:hypothetical protein
MFSRKKIQRIPHPAYSPDVAPNDFFLFGYIKRKLTEYNIHDRQSLQSAIADIFDEIGQKTLMAVFETWINRLEWSCIESMWKETDLPNSNTVRPLICIKTLSVTFEFAPQLWKATRG